MSGVVIDIRTRQLDGPEPFEPCKGRGTMPSRFGLVDFGDDRATARGPRYVQYIVYIHSHAVGVPSPIEGAER